VSVSVSLRGNLTDFGIADVFQLVGQQRKTGILELARRGEAARIAFEQGAVLLAEPVGRRPDDALADRLVRSGLLTRERVEVLRRECEASAESLAGRVLASGALSPPEVEEVRELLTRDTLFDILRWSKGSFEFKPQPVTGERPAGARLGAEQILMDGLRMADEWQQFAEAVPSEDLVFERVGEWAASAGEATAAQQRVWLLVDGRLSARRIVDLSRLGTFEATRALARLRQLGVIRPLEAGPGLPRPRARGVRPAPRGALGRLAAALLPLALLAVVSGVAGGAGAGAGPAFGLGPSSLELARAAFAQRRVRHALEAFALREGRWPERLGELAERGLLPPSQLAAPGGAPYYYARRGAGALLLAPER
jgi:hypothetical protein